MKKLNLIVFCLMIFTTNCGFKVVDRSKLINFDIVDVSSVGEKKINFNLKNKLMSNSYNNNNTQLRIKLNTTKKKSIKEKNIKNEITKYQIEIITSLEFEIINTKKKSNFLVKRISEYNVADQYSQTLDNEKKLIKILTNSLSDDIYDELIIRVNAL
jgi:hypothetical protein|tara:strand:+ start:579 stop:1049 length:471 start_codon:yes stop_codon:yes gene_type:complete